jgi:hypothetical protein
MHIIEVVAASLNFFFSFELRYSIVIYRVRTALFDMLSFITVKNIVGWDANEFGLNLFTSSRDISRPYRVDFPRVLFLSFAFVYICLRRSVN